ncbi:MAG: ComF family protein [Pseudomonadota bacterium]
MRLQTMLHAVFPPECLGCGARVDQDFAICGSCWAETPFIFGASCHLCGVALPGQADEGEVLTCDDCMSIARPWEAGRAVFGYSGMGRRLVLGLKHGDRAEVARAAGPWLARAGADLLVDDPVIVPVPLHWRRLAKRRFNQAALLALALARETGLTCVPDALIRRHATESQDGRDRDGRFRNVSGAISAHPKHAARLDGKPVLLIDDVMTSGATFAAATEACQSAGAASIRVLALARVGKDA